MELGEHNTTVNALLPGLVDTAVTPYEKRLSESMGEQGQKVERPTPQQA
jgi:NAD(P)-dependent dehydrogenase (short-subunit alcohol dehydrogenase family)